MIKLYSKTAKTICQQSGLCQQLLLIIILLSIGSLRIIAQNWQCGDTLIDSRDGQKYPTVLIGTQCWMAKNLNIGEYVESFYTGSSHTEPSNNGVIEKYCFENDTANCMIYGGLYDWEEMTNYTSVGAGLPDSINRGICPTGWHIPSSGSAFGVTGSTQEWEVLEQNYSQSTAALELKEGGSSGFNAQLGGYRTEWGLWDTVYIDSGGGRSGSYWSTLSSFANNKLGRTFYSNYDSLTVLYDEYYLGLSVRCIKDKEMTNTLYQHFANRQDLTVYPSPGSHFVYIDLNPSIYNHSVIVYNILGEVINALIEKSNGRLRLNIRDLYPGTYFIRLGNKTGIFIKT